MLSPDEVFNRRQELKLSADRLASAMGSRGHAWTEATVTMVEIGAHVITEAEGGDLADILGLATPEATDDPDDVVTVTLSHDGTVAITPDNAPPETAVFLLVQAIDTFLHPRP